MDNLETREQLVELRFDTTTRQLSGIAVPYGEISPSYNERFAPGSVTLDPNALLLWQHDRTEPIGKITAGQESADGFHFSSAISDTVRGRDAATLASDGCLSLSVGFIMRDSAVVDGITEVRDAVVKEISLVSFPAYAGAVVTDIRDDNNTDSEIPDSALSKEHIVDETTDTASDLAEVREAIQHLEREVAGMNTVDVPSVDTRSTGEFVLALAKGDETAIRAYTGATTSDTVTSPIDRDLTRIVESAAPLRQVFSTGTTPEKGMSIYFAQLTGITDGTAAQAAEGDDLGYYEIQQGTKNVSLKTIGSYAQLSIQSILRSTSSFLDSTFRGQAIALGNKLNSELVAQYQTTVAAQIVAANKVTIKATSATYNDFLAGITDAAVKFATLGLPLEYMIVDTATFKELMALQGSDGRPVLLVDGNGSNNVGSISPTGLGGQFAGVRVVAVSQLNTNKSQCAFVNSAALRQYTSPSLRLETDNAINLSSAYSLSLVTAVADEYPTAIVGIVRANS
jgi:HK97 family phage prohead protease